MMDNKAGFNLEEIDAYLEFWAVDCEGEGYPCNEKCPHHSLCHTLSSEDHRRMAREIRRLIDTLTERAQKRLELMEELDNALHENQELVEKQHDLIEKQNALLATMGVICPKEEDE